MGRSVNLININPDKIIRVRDCFRASDGHVTLCDIRGKNLSILHCECSRYLRKQTCKHVQAVIKKRLDVHDEEGGLFTLDPGQWYEVLIYGAPVFSILANADDPIPPTNFREVRVGTGGVIDVPVGFVPNYCSMDDVRTLFIEWLTGHWAIEHENEDYCCRAPQHSPGAGMYEDWSEWLDNDGAPTKKLLMEWWSLYCSQTCLACQEDNGVPDI